MVTGAAATVQQVDALRKDLDALSRRVDGLVAGLNATMNNAKTYVDQIRRFERIDVARLEHLIQLDVGRLSAANFTTLGEMVANHAHDVAKIALLEREMAKIALLQHRLDAVQQVVTRLVNQGRP